MECFKKFELPEEAQQAFHKLVQAFMTAGVLQHFNYHLPTRLETDASDFAIAGVLKQEHEGCWHLVAFYSRKMSSAEKNYEIHDKELLAVYHPGDKGGEPDALTRRIDMQPIGEEQEHNVQQLLPSQVFEKVESGIEIGSGLRQIPAENVITSTILPISVESVSPTDLENESVLAAPMLTMDTIATKGLRDLTKIFQPLDPELQEIHAKKPFETKDDLWHSGGRLVIPKVTMPGRTNDCQSRSAQEVDGQSLSVEHLQFMVMTQCHDGITAGHVGRDATIRAAQRHYWWPNMTAWIADYVASCPVCARYKAPCHHPYGLLQPLTTPDRPWGSVSLDFIEGLPVSKGFDSILVIVDRLTKYAILAPTHKTVMATQTAVLLWRYMV
ncbi:hypothetical protein NDA14_000565 [Ustilago hordei]|nr:hypothetical protein NDA14_000565 [Ustilago hordei]